METKSLKSTKIDSYLVCKTFFESFISLVFLFIAFFVYLFLVLKNRSIKEKVFEIVSLELYKNNIVKLYYFKVDNSFFRKLPLFYSILKRDISLVGLYFTKPQENSEIKIGIFTLWQIRDNLKMQNVDKESCNEEYIKNRAFVYDIKLIIKSLFSLIFFSKNLKDEKRVDILGVSFDNLSLNNILDIFSSKIENKRKCVISFVNAHCLNISVENSKYKESLKRSDYILADGSGVNLACNILNKRLKENLNGTDLLPHICSLAQRNSYKIYLLGAKEGVADDMKKELEKKYKGIKIVGLSSGYFENEEEVIKNINEKDVDILLVAMGVPMQEIFIDKNRDKIDAKIIMGVGGLFDFYSNRIKRAPLFLRETGLEWIYRMIQEPKRMWRRYILGNPLFIYRVCRFKKEIDKNPFMDKYLKTYNKKNKSNKNIFLWRFSLIFKRFIKRAFDIFASIILLIVFTPLFLLVAILIRVESKGGVIFKQKRVGLNGEFFRMYKFRSMRIDAEELKKELMKTNESKDGVIFKMKDDPRITKVGKFIRKTSIDELPQLVNVLKGEMSLVGPRPPVPEEVEQYNIEDKKRLDVKPGITCIWQVSGRSQIPFKQQVEMDKEYIKGQSFYKDIALLFKTIPAVLFSKGAY